MCELIALDLHSSMRQTAGPIPRGHGASWLLRTVLATVVVLPGLLLWIRFKATQGSAVSFSKRKLTLVSYSYFEKDATQAANFEFFLSVGMGYNSTYSAPADTDFVVVQSGPDCTPCAVLDKTMHPSAKITEQLPHLLSGAYIGTAGLTLLHRTENEGMDIAAHNVTIAFLQSQRKLKSYKYFIFLNSSIKGPFFPAWVPASWQWTDAFTDRLTDTVKAVGSSLTCLPERDPGGPGPKLESWAFAVDQIGLDILMQEGIFEVRTCKICVEGVVVKGEYGLSEALLQRGYNIATLLSMYPKDIDWRDPRHHTCNDNIHPSRHGTYDSITMHPYETIFVKSSWHVGEPFTSHYSNWFLRHGRGPYNTDGRFDETMYLYAIGKYAIMPDAAALNYYQVTVEGDINDHAQSEPVKEGAVLV